MKYEEIVKQVSQRAGLDDRDEAARAATATLDVLGQRLAGNEPSNLAAQLPAELKDPLTRHEGTAEDFDTVEFTRRVAQHGGGDNPEQAIHNVRAVLATLAEFVSTGELDDLRSQLPPDYERLFLP